MGSIRQRLRDERGISAVIAAISLVALFGAAMLSIDYGNTIQTRRNLITGTDATALEQAKVEAKTPGAGCQLGWTDYLARNVGTFVSGTEQCIRHPDPANPGTGWIEVQARKEAQTRFGGLFGLGNTQPWSLSAAQYGFATGVRGLRPMSFCNLNGHIQEWLDIVDLEPDGSTITPAEQESYNLLRGNPTSDHPIYSGAGVVHRMFETKTWNGGGSCPDLGAASGNWGWQDFNCVQGQPATCGNSNPDLGTWIRDGWDGDVRVFTGPHSTCDTSDDPFSNPGGCLNGTTGARGNSLNSSLQTLVDSGVKFYVPIFKNVCCTGQSIHMQVYGFLGVRLWGFGSVRSDPYFDLEFFDILTSGICCSKTPTGTNLKAVKLCDVDHDPDATSANQAPNCS